MIPTIPFTPPHVSVNRVRIVDLPGVAVDADVRGHSAYELLSLNALIRYTSARAEALGLPSDLGQDSDRARLGIPRFLNDCLRNDAGRAKETAAVIARRLGRNLGYVLLTLHRGDAVNRAARSDWTDADWERWRDIRRVWLAGGLTSGALGALILEHGQGLLDGYNVGLELGLSSYPGSIPLLGASRYLPAGDAEALVFDFGHTRIKRACLHLVNDAITNLWEFEPWPVPSEFFTEPWGSPEEMGRRVLEFVTDVIAQTRNAALDQGRHPGPDLMLCVAAYVQGGKLLGNGLYANLSVLADDVRPLLAASLHRRTGAAFRVHLIHDGTAAAAVHAGEPHTAVIMMGTALGVGFAPATAEGLRRLPV